MGFSQKLKKIRAVQRVKIRRAYVLDLKEINNCNTWIVQFLELRFFIINNNSE